MILDKILAIEHVYDRSIATAISGNSAYCIVIIYALFPTRLGDARIEERIGL